MTEPGGHAADVGKGVGLLDEEGGLASEQTRPEFLVAAVRVDAGESVVSVDPLPRPQMVRAIVAVGMLLIVGGGFLGAFGYALSLTGMSPRRLWMSVGVAAVVLLPLLVIVVSAGFREALRQCREGTVVSVERSSGEVVHGWYGWSVPIDDVAEIRVNRGFMIIRMVSQVWDWRYVVQVELRSKSDPAREMVVVSLDRFPRRYTSFVDPIAEATGAPVVERWAWRFRLEEDLSR